MLKLPAVPERSIGHPTLKLTERCITRILRCAGTTPVTSNRRWRLVPAFKKRLDDGAKNDEFQIDGTQPFCPTEN